MAKGAEKKKTNLMLNTAQKQSQDYTSDYLRQTSPERDAARAKGNDLYDFMSKGYKDLATNKGISPQLLGAIRGGGGSSGGGGGGGGGSRGYSASTGNVGGYGDVKTAYSDFMKGGGVNLAFNQQAMGNLAGLAGSGGWSPADKAAQLKLIAGLTSMGETGGLDAASMNRMRGLGVFDEFAKTGGFTPGQIQDIRSRATSQIPATYAANRAEAERMGRVTGQYNPAVAAQMQRQTGYDSSKAALDAELGISEQVRGGRQWGAGAASESELALQNLRTSNMLQGLTGAGGMRQGMLSDIAGNRINAAGTLGQLDIGGQGLIQEGKMFGTKGMQDVIGQENQESAQAAAQRNAAAAHNSAMRNAAAGRAAQSNAQRIANEKWLAGFGVENQLAGLGGLGNLYTSHPAEVEYYDRARQGSVNANVANTGNLAGMRIQNNPQTDWGQVAGGIAGAAVGGLTGGFGFGGGGKKKKTPSVDYMD